jgi:N-glycosylase/DNA lyase
MGYKEASHFLRNIGFADDLAILDRHILKNLKIFGIIEEIPKSLSKKKYLEIEEKMRNLANEVNIPLSHLDLLFWSKETGEIFK